MGQYWVPVNLDKKEFVEPNRLGAGNKLREQLGKHPGTGAALIVLCAAMPRPRGIGDLDRSDDAGQIIGRWAGDRIALVGDYAKDSDLPPEHHAGGIYGCCDYGDCGPLGQYKDITDGVCAVIERELGGRFVGESRRFEWNNALSRKELEAEVEVLRGQMADLRNFIVRHYAEEVPDESTFQLIERLLQRLRYAEARVEVDGRVKKQLQEERGDYQDKARRANWAIGEVNGLATDALVADGGHHKQWYLERILTQLGVDLVALEKGLRAKGFIVHKGEAP